MDRVVAIINPASGSSDEDFRAAVERALRSGGADYEIRETTPSRGGAPLATEAVREGVGHLIACGGDGTVMAVVNGLFQAEAEASRGVGRTILSIVPGGTANLVATALEIPMETEEAVRVALTGGECRIDLGRCEAGVFALGIGLGLTERLVSRASAGTKEKIGRWAYLLAMLRELGARPNTFALSLDGGPERCERGVAVVIANTGDIGHGMRFAPDARMDDGLLDVCILHRFYLRDVVRMAWRVLRGDLENDRVVTFMQARQIALRSDPPLDVQMDGEAIPLKPPLVAEVVPGALRVRVPLDTGSKEERNG